jgi:hypothetical protein
MLMENKTQQQIIKEEIQAVLDDIIDVYNKSGKRTSGEFEKGLEAIYTDDGAIIKGHYYLAGRVSGKRPPMQEIKKWIETKGIKPYSEKMSITSLAFLIAKKIGENGTKKSNHLKVYQQVITPQRIDEIIKKVSVFNVNLFVKEITTQLELLTKQL